jgi:hypothetical protein
MRDRKERRGKDRKFVDGASRKRKPQKHKDRHESQQELQAYYR